MTRRFIATALVSCALVLAPATAHAGGSDSPTPYTVNSEGITLPTGQTFPAHGHVNLTTSQGGKGIHFDPNNNQPGGQWIGQRFIPWSAFGLKECDTVSWVQVSLYNEHYGEGGQSPVTVGDCPPTEEPPPAPEPTPPEPTPDPEPTPSEPPVDEEPTPEPEETATSSTSRPSELAETGANGNAWLFAGAGLLLLVAGASLVTYRKR